MMTPGRFPVGETRPGAIPEQFEDESECPACADAAVPSSLAFWDLGELGRQIPRIWGHGRDAQAARI